MAKLHNDALIKGNLWKNILIFSLPLMASNLLQIFFNISDVAVIGQFAGDISLGAVGSTSTLILLYTGILTGLASGLNAIVAQHLGSRNQKGTHDVIHNSLLVFLITGLILFILGVFGSKYLLILLKTKEVFLDKSILYLKIYFCGIIGMAIYNFGNAIYSAQGNTEKPLIFLAIAGVVNIGLNLFFVIVCKMDVAGVALASAISQWLSAILIIISLGRRHDDIALNIKDIRFYKTYTLTLLRIGLPSSFQFSLFAIANLFIQSAINSLDALTVEGIVAAQNADSLVWDTMAAFYTACSSFIGQNYGAGQKDRVLKSYLITLLYSAVLGIVMGGALVLLYKPFLSIFTKQEAVMEAGKTRLIIMAFSYWISAFMDNTTAASRGLGKTAIPTIIVIIGSVVLRIVWILTIFKSYQTVESIFLLYSVSWGVTSIFEIIYFVYLYKKTFPNNNLA